VLVVNASSDGYGFFGCQFNSDTGANYNRVLMKGDGSTASSSSNTGVTGINANSAASMASGAVSTTVNVLDYSAIDKHKSVLIRADQAASGVDATAGRWASTSAINSVRVYIFSGNFAAGSSFALYGIVA